MIISISIFFSTIDLQKREVYFLRRNLHHYNIYKNEKSNRHAAKRGNLKVFILYVYTCRKSVFFCYR